MSHQEKQEIFDRYAKSKGFLSWDHIYTDNQIGLMSKDEFLIFMFDACNVVQAEQQKRIAENVMMKNHDGSSKVNRHLTYFQNGADNIQIDKETITNPENKIH